MFLSSCLERFLVALSTTLHLNTAWKYVLCYWHEIFSLNIPSHRLRQEEQKLSICLLHSVHYFMYFFYIPCFLQGELFLEVWLFLSLFNAALLETRLPTTLRVPGGPAPLITFNHYFPSHSLWIAVPSSFFLQAEQRFSVENWKLVVPGSCKQGPSKTLWHLKKGGQVFLEMTQLLQ